MTRWFVWWEGGRYVDYEGYALIGSASISQYYIDQTRVDEQLLAVL